MLDLIIAAAEKSVYPIIFLFMLIEGPTTNFIASMVSGASNLNIFIIGGMAIIGDFIGDCIYYGIGKRISGIKYKEKLKKVKSKKLFYELEKVIKKNLFISLLIIKIAPISGIGLIYAGKKKISFKKFSIRSLILCILINIPISAAGFSLIIGLKEFLNLQNALQMTGLIIGTLAIIVFVLYMMRKYLNRLFFNVLKRFDK